MKYVVLLLYPHLAYETVYTKKGQVTKQYHNFSVLSVTGGKEILFPVPTSQAIFKLSS